MLLNPVHPASSQTLKHSRPAPTNSVIKHVFSCSNPYIYTTVVQEVYNRDCSPEVDDIEGLAAAATQTSVITQTKG